MEKKKKTVRAWAILNDKNKVIAVEIGRSKPTHFSIGTWGFSTDGNQTVPCTITFIPPKK